MDSTTYGVSVPTSQHWNAFKAYYIKYKLQIINDLVVAACPNVFISGDGEFGEDIKQRIFFNQEDAYTAGGMDGADDVDWDNPDATQDYISDQAADSYNNQCAAAADVVIAQLRNCIIETNELYNGGDQTLLNTRLASLKTELTSICVAGYNPSNPIPVSISSEGSFVGAIDNFFDDYSSDYTKTTSCNEMTVTLPKPPGYGSSTMRPLDDCACDKLADLQADY
ncbi:MAG: hypothetical protein M0D57_08600 [Sphingobacteriales bacterium JAD_PAG50586_3]|nr:MAG: hypothetical protein M0D57_08600 [Sphingobacteriales bacterium JAD_PAG50586_3]